MSRITWDEPGTRYFETGVRNCVLYLQDDNGVWTGYPWNGITAINLSPDGGDPIPVYGDDNTYYAVSTMERLKGTIEAYTYPDEWALCDGSLEIDNGVFIGQQMRKEFALCFRTAILSDENKDFDDLHKIHILYGCLASPSDVEYSTINDGLDISTFSWDFVCNPLIVSGDDGVYAPISSLTIDTTRGMSQAKQNQIESVLYGSYSAAPTLLYPNDVVGWPLDRTIPIACDLWMCDEVRCV